MPSHQPRRPRWLSWFDSRLELNPEGMPLGARLTAAERECLEAMRPASSELIAARDLLRRTDTKFLFPRRELEFVLRAMRDRFDLVRSGGALVGSYQSRYFDTGDRQFFHAHRRGLRPRKKVRIRRYAERRTAFLEIKTRENADVSFKLRRPRPYADLHLSGEDQDFLRSELGDLSLEPSALVDFPRMTLVCGRFDERVTFDLGLSLRLGEARIELPGVVVGEVKQEHYRARSPGMLALRTRCIRPTRMSKYCVGMSLLGDGLPIHRFRQPVRELLRNHDA